MLNYPEGNTSSHRRRWYFLVPLNRFLDRWIPGRFLGGFLMGPDSYQATKPTWSHVWRQVCSSDFHALCSCFNHAQAQRCVLVGNLVVRRSQFWKGEFVYASRDPTVLLYNYIYTYILYIYIYYIYILYIYILLRLQVPQHGQMRNLSRHGWGADVEWKEKPSSLENWERIATWNWAKDITCRQPSRYTWWPVMYKFWSPQKSTFQEHFAFAKSLMDC